MCHIEPKKNYPCVSFLRMTNRPILYFTNLTGRVLKTLGFKNSGYVGSKTVNFFVVSAVIPSLSASNLFYSNCSYPTNDKISNEKLLHRFTNKCRR